MVPVALAITIAGVLALLASALFICLFRFERYVGLRYLRKGETSPAVTVALLASIALTGASFGVFWMTRGQLRHIETVAVAFTLVGAIATMLCLLLRMFSVFTTVSTMGVVLGVASLVVVLAVTTGFEREFREKVLAVNAHLIVTPYGTMSMEEMEREADSYAKKLRDLPGLERMAKFSFSAAEVMIGPLGANLKGLDPADPAPELRRGMVTGSLDDLRKPAVCPGVAGDEEEDAGRVVLGEDMARRLRAKVGDCVQLLVPYTGGIDSAPASYQFRVLGTFSLGFHEYDARLAFISIEDARRLGNARDSIFGLELRFADPLAAMKIQEEVERRLGPDVRVLDWETLNKNLFTALVMQKLIIALILMIIILVAAFNIVASLTLIVLSKVREIAILSAMGAKPRSLVRIFIVAGSFVGFVGTGLGILYGLAVCGLARLYEFPLDPKVYLIAQLPVEISARELLFVAAATQLICLLATLYPASRARRLQVIEGLRYT